MSVRVDLEPPELYEVLKIVEELDRKGVPGTAGLSIHYAYKKLKEAHEAQFKEPCGSRDVSR